MQYRFALLVRSSPQAQQRHKARLSELFMSRANTGGHSHCANENAGCCLCLHRLSEAVFSVRVVRKYAHVTLILAVCLITQMLSSRTVCCYPLTFGLSPAKPTASRSASIEIVPWSLLPLPSCSRDRSCCGGCPCCSFFSRSSAAVRPGDACSRRSMASRNSLP